MLFPIMSIYSRLDMSLAIKNIRGILFDVDGTLYHQLPCRIIMIFLILFLNFHKPKELFRKVKVIVQYRKAQEYLRESPMKHEEKNNQLMLTAKKTGESPSYISKVIEEWFEKKPLPFIRLCRRRGMKKFLNLWYENGLILGVYSDYPVKNKLQALGISRFITQIVSADNPEVHGFKPNTNGFDVAAKKMGIEPSNILYIGDRPEVDGVGGSKAGMQVVILNSILKKNNYDYPTVSTFYDLSKIIQSSG